MDSHPGCAPGLAEPRDRHRASGMSDAMSRERQPAPRRSDDLDSLLAGLDTLPQDDSGAAARAAWLHAVAARLVDAPDGSRLAALAAALRADPARAARFRATVRSLVARESATRFLAESGVVPRSSLADEAFVRVLRRLAGPGTTGPIAAAFAGPKASAWLAARTEDEVAAFLDAAGLAAPADRGPGLRAAADALLVHTTRAASIGLSPGVRRALGDPPVSASPFRQVARAGMRLHDALSGDAPDAAPDRAAALAARAELEAALLAAKAERERAYAELERTGVSAEMVLALDVLGRTLDRIADPLPLLAPRPDDRPAAAAARVLLRIAADLRHDASLLHVFSDRSRLLAKKVVERCGAIGTHYITSDRAEWWDMLRRGAGGGALVTFVVWGKLAIHDLHPPAGVAALLSFTDYAAGFLVIHALHLTLATKQPPMTAAALADAIATAQSPAGERRAGDSAPVVAMLRRISRSQVAGLAGNLVTVAAGCLVLDFAVRGVTGDHVLDAAGAAYTFAGHRPFDSGCVAFAAITGAAVWLSSMTAGWAENALAFAGVRDAVEGRRGPVAWLVRNAGGVAGNVSLAAMLPLITLAGKVFGVPFDVRHVTVSTGQVVLACATDGGLSREGLWAIGGVAMIGAVNIATGFALSYWVAARARGVQRGAPLRLFPALLRSLFVSPLGFLFPPRDGAAPQHHARH